MKIPDALVVTRVFDATPEEIWSAFTDPEKLHKFFGPAGTTIPLEELKMDVRVGGEFSLTMHNEENGELYPMSAKYVILEEPNKIQFKTEGGIEGTVEFEDLGLAGKTLLTWTTVAPFDESFFAGAVVGTHSAVDNLEALLAGSLAAGSEGAAPFTLTNMKQDLEDVGSNFGGPADLEFKMATDALELEQSGLTYQRVPAGYRFPYGHKHKTQEEIYVVVGGSGRMKLGDEIVELKQWDAVRVFPATWRGYEAGPEGLELLVIGAPSLGDARREDVEGQRGWWADE
jgi:uncharacterized protein YndB with AHSA1/START domain/mannose-6-phosphate isomerase-like protein (cupin superfamily)